MKNKYRITEKRKGHFWLKSIPNNIILVFADKIGFDFWLSRSGYVGELPDAIEFFKKKIDEIEEIESYPKYHKI